MPRISRPPKLALRILRRFMPRKDARSLTGDYVEIFHDLHASRGPLAARLWLWWQVLAGLPRFLQHHSYWSLQMFRSYLLTTLRNVRRDKLHSFINILGLAIGLACVILIFLVVRYEFSFDRFNPDSDRIYRLFTESTLEDEVFSKAPTMLPLAPALRRDFPEVERAARVSRRSAILVSSGEHRFYESLHFADPDVFAIFNLPLKSGDPETAFARPDSVVLTEAVAEKYFGRSDPMGRVLRINNERDFTVTGIFEPIPDTFHLRVRLLASFESLRSAEKDRWDSWDTFSNDYTYILLASGTDPAGFEARLPEFQRGYAGADIADKQALRLQALRDIHFSSLNYDDAVVYEKSYLYAFSAVAVFILILACVNFMNLATARATRRAREVGMRKVVGAGRGQLIRQFLTESFLLTFGAVAAAVGLVYLVLPRFRVFLNRRIVFDLIRDPTPAAMLLGLVLVTGFVAGGYPAFLLSAFSPVRALRAKQAAGSRRLSFRTMFVVLQFAVSIALIIATLVVFQQLSFMKSKDLGFAGEQVVVIPLQNSPLRRNPEPYKSAILNSASVLGASCANGTPGSGSSAASNYVLETPLGDKEIYLQTIYTDFDFVSTFGLRILDGRDLSREFGTDASGEAYLLNQTAADQMEWDSPVGRLISRGGENPGRVIGVVEDFHYYSMRSRIDPIAIVIKPSRIGYIAVRIRPEEASRTLDFLEETWNRFAPAYPFEHFFTSERFARFYRFEQSVGRLFALFAGLAVVISCLGVFGLISFTAEQSTKEIGVRKVMGAGVGGIVLLLTRRFIRWALLANLFAWPIAWYVMFRWLEGFAYRVPLNAALFPLAGLLVLIVALATVSYQAVKAALADPVQALRYE